MPDFLIVSTNSLKLITSLWFLVQNLLVEIGRGKKSLKLIKFKGEFFSWFTYFEQRMGFRCSLIQGSKYIVRPHLRAITS